MNRQEAIAYMAEKIQEIERERIAAHLSLDPAQQKKAAVESILKLLKGVQIDHEVQQD